jgi:hypothetical protein
MFVRKVTVRRPGGRDVYLQLAHNERDPRTGYSRPRILYGFGKKENVDVGAIKRLIRSLAGILPASEAVAAQAVEAQSGCLRFLGSRPFGGGWVLQGLWKGLGIEREIRACLEGRGKDAGEIERGIFAMVANRALAPSSKRAVTQWAREDAALPNVPALSPSGLYRAMDFLLDARGEIEQNVFSSVATLLNLEVDLLFFDTTMTHFEVEEEDSEGLRRFGRAGALHAELPQALVGMAVTKEGIPVKAWVWPGNTSDQKVVAQVKRELTAWRLGRLVWVMDRGMASEENAIRLQEAGHHFILGERMRSSKAAREALSRPGRYAKVREGLWAKEVVVGAGERRRRYVVVHSEERERRDRQERAGILEEIQRRLEALSKASGPEHRREVCALIGHKTLGRYVVARGGAAEVDRSKVESDAALDGKYLLRTSDDTLSVEDVVLGYKKLAEVERAWRDLKHVLDVRPIYHRKERRIKAHVLLCWLGLLLVRVAETRTGETWRTLRREFSRIHLVRYAGAAGEVLQTTEIAPETSKRLKALEIAPPPRYVQITPSKKRRTRGAKPS